MVCTATACRCEHQERRNRVHVRAGEAARAGGRGALVPTEAQPVPGEQPGERGPDRLKRCDRNAPRAAAASAARLPRLPRPLLTARPPPRETSGILRVYTFFYSFLLVNQVTSLTVHSH